jgi:hypothetical protein
MYWDSLVRTGREIMGRKNRRKHKGRRIIVEGQFTSPEDASKGVETTTVKPTVTKAGESAVEGAVVTNPRPGVTRTTYPATGCATNKAVTNNATDSGWEVKIDEISDCSKAPTDMTIWMMPTAKVKIDMLMAKFPSIEWLAYLIGKDKVVEDIFIPEQTVTATRVDNVVCPEFNELNIIGVIHSHHEMGSGFSGTDDDWINQNHDISICIAKTSINAQYRWKTPCGGLKIIKGNVKLKLQVEINKTEFDALIADKINKKTYRAAMQPYVNGYQKRTGSNVTIPNAWDTGKEEKSDSELSLEEELELLEQGYGHGFYPGAMG